MKKSLNLDFSLKSNTQLSVEDNGDNYETVLGNTLLNSDNLYLIGSEAILEKDTPGTQGTGDSLMLLFNAIADGRNTPLDERPSDEHAWHIWLSKNSLDRTSCESAWQRILDTLDLNKYISEDLADFLDKGIKYHLVDTIFTTCIDPILEILMRSICDDYGRKFRVFNFMDDAQFVSYSNRRSEECITLVYLWGRIGASRNDLGATSINYVYTEDDAMKTIAELIKADTDNKRELLREIFFNKRVMAIGCRFDDWKFRFFWYSMRGDLEHLSHGTVSYSCIDPANDALYQYLESTKGLHVDNDSRKFLSTMAALIESDDMFNKIREKRVSTANGIFISYKTEDVRTTTKIFRYLSSTCNFKVWMDCQKLKTGDRYTPEIINAINSSDIFMPILSTDVAMDLKAGKQDGYYIKEWKAANGKTFVPIAIGDYDCRAEYHKVFREICGFADEKKDITIYSVNDMDKIVDKIKELLAK